jgi:hypothetical protein
MRNSAILFAVSTLLVACGGGGGGGDAPAAASPSTAGKTQVTLSSANYVGVAQESMSSSSYLADAGSLATGADVSNADVLVRFGQAQAGKVAAWLASTQALATGAVTTTTEACAGGGSLTVVDNDLNGNGLPDAGDSVALTATNCVFEGSTLNGGLTLAVTSFSGNANAPPFSAAFALTFVNLTARSATASSTGNGTMALSLNATTTSNHTVTLKAPQFSTTSTYGGATYSRTLENYTVVVDETAASSRTTATGTLTSSAFESKTVTIATPVPFVRVFPQTRPSSGQATATGANGGVVRITAISNTQVKIELDADANGTFETSVIKLWSELI